ncbi:hypothetical protein EVAR_99661_1 [Eumeta japonica]|uniref:Uncharacterized protein n=1 Tax=Eumeta variegata TaxID=151549 RepID=A0A4C1S905_EUMVA|nr:hypothetical protein EVAR_99661_1 [Eumeta japonica]
MRSLRSEYDGVTTQSRLTGQSIARPKPWYITIQLPYATHLNRSLKCRSRRIDNNRRSCAVVRPFKCRETATATVLHALKKNLISLHLHSKRREHTTMTLACARICLFHVASSRRRSRNLADSPHSMGVAEDGRSEQSFSCKHASNEKGKTLQPPEARKADRAS